MGGVWGLGLGGLWGGGWIEAVLWTRLWVLLLAGGGVAWVLRLGFRGMEVKEVGGSGKKSGFSWGLWKSCVEKDLVGWSGFWFE